MLPNREQLDARFRADPYMGRLGARLDSWDGGTATVRWTPTDDDCNFAGTVHGGALFSLADVAFAVSSNSWGRVAVALTVEAHYLAAPEVGRELVAVSTERSRSRRTASYLIEVAPAAAGDIEVAPAAAGDIEVAPAVAGDIEVAPASGDELVASIHAMVYRTGRWHFGEDAWPEEWRDVH